jgi:hypothetical protein
MNNRVLAASICVICHRAFEEYGHNAMPVRSGRCCNVCNDAVIIPARLKRLRRATVRGEDE